jgi:hypothetical protein
MDGGWLQAPCTFYLSRSYARKCCACERVFGFMNRGYTCEFCGYFCHSDGECSRKMWLRGELLRRRICSKCDRYRNVCKQLREGAEFTLYEASGSRCVTMELSESAGELRILQRETKETVDSVYLDRLEGVRRGFSHGGHLRTANYDPLRSLSITVRKGKRENSVTTYNLKAMSAWTCQMWVEGLLSAKYVQRRVEDQLLAREWYESHGHTLHSAGSRLLHNYLPKNSEMRRFRVERRQAKSASSSIRSNDSGVVSDGGSLEHLDLRDMYVVLEMPPNSTEVITREIHPSLLSEQHSANSSLFCPEATFSPSPGTPEHTHTSHTSSSPLPISTEDLITRSTPGLPYTKSPNSPNSSSASLCSCHAYQIVTLDWTRPSGGERGRRSGSRSTQNCPWLSQSRCCSRCEGHCKFVANVDSL